ncbi:MAG: alpha/beta hydrolase [Actinomycetota bacterium]|nr:alpha/beta hydrolase [Actinomycetota bacterium]
MTAATTARLRRVAQCVGALAAITITAGCGASGGAGVASSTATESIAASELTSAETSTPGAPVTADYLPGLAATVRAPDSPGPAPLVVLVPGGGWSSADPNGLVPLAELLTASGATTSLITYSTTTMGAVFPQPVDDVACAVRWSAEQATAMGHPPSRVVLVGHSAGGHLATLVALSGDKFGGDCAPPVVAVDGVAGLAGVYDTTWPVGALNAFFGGVYSVDGRAKGSPLEWAKTGAAPAGLRVLLVHGDEDYQVPLEQTALLAEALEAAEVDLTLEVLAGEDHMTVFDAAVAGPIITRWLAAFPSAPEE